MGAVGVQLWNAFAFAAVAIASGQTAAVDSGTELPGIHNFQQATTNLFSGSQPEGEAAFAALAKLGVKTILSVDGARPDVALAAKHGLRYIHLPIGYDGIASRRISELAQAALSAAGPVYVHCHHGLHRGPTAVAAICRSTAGWEAARAVQFMQQAGTSPEYAGLYRTIRELSPPSPAQLAAVGTNFPATARTSSLVDAMVAIDAHFDRLKQAGRKTSVAAQAAGPAGEALLLIEQYRELARNPDTARRPADYRARLDEARQAAEALQVALRSDGRVQTALDRVRQSCTRCHTHYRNE